MIKKRKEKRKLALTTAINFLKKKILKKLVLWIVIVMR